MGYYSVVDAASSGIGQDMAGNARVTFYVQVEDLQGALGRALRLGGRLAMLVTATPGDPAIAKFHEPAGNVTGLIQS
jgi:predicted enzyme related to lactoylglutathione lyase